MNDIAEQSVAKLRRTLLLLAANQSEQQQIEAAGRHLEALGAAMIWGEAEASTRLDHPEHGEEGTHTMPAVPTMTVYLAGPMSGWPDGNYPAFWAAAAQLRALGYDVVSPAELHRHPAEGQLRAHAACMRRAILAMLGPGVSAIVLLPGWEASRGACLEEAVARACGLQVLALPALSQATRTGMAPRGAAEQEQERPGPRKRKRKRKREEDGD